MYLLLELTDVSIREKCNVKKARRNLRSKGGHFESRSILGRFSGNFRKIVGIFRKSENRLKVNVLDLPNFFIENSRKFSVNQLEIYPK